MYIEYIPYHYSRSPVQASASYLPGKLSLKDLDRIQAATTNKKRSEDQKERVARPLYSALLQVGSRVLGFKLGHIWSSGCASWHSLHAFEHQPILTAEGSEQAQV